MVLSRRDSLIVARHEVPREPVPEGRPKSLTVTEIFVAKTEFMSL